MNVAVNEARHDRLRAGVDDLGVWPCQRADFGISPKGGDFPVFHGKRGDVGLGEGDAAPAEDHDVRIGHEERLSVSP